MSWMIRTATTADLPHLAGVEIDAGERFRLIGLGAIADDDPVDDGALASHVAGGTAWVAVEKESGTVIGYALGSVVDGEGHLDQVSVVQRSSGQGIGRALVAAVERWAVDRGFQAVTLTTFVDVAWNGPYYESLGYRIVPADEMGPELAAIRHRERAAGLDVAPRTAMVRQFDVSHR